MVNFNYKFFALKKMLILLILCGTVVLLKAQQFKNNVGAPYIGLSAYSQLNNDVFGFGNNAAAIGNFQKSGVGVFGERRFGLSELNNLGLLGSIGLKNGGVGVQVNRFGFSGFNETQIGVGYGRALSEKISVGGKANYYQQQIAGYGNGSTVNVELGVLLHLTSKLTSGISAFNPLGGKFGINKTEKLASIYKLGLGYDASDKVNIATEIIKEEGTPINLVAAIHYQFDKKFFVKAGAGTAASNFFAAAGVFLNQQFRLDVFASHHQQLGFSPGVMIQYNFSKKETGTN